MLIEITVYYKRMKAKQPSQMWLRLIKVSNQSETRLRSQGLLLALPCLHVAYANFIMAAADRKIHRGL